PKGVRRLVAGSVRIGTAHLRRKYAVRPVHDDEIEPDLAAIRAAIDGRPSREPLLGRFTLADVAIAAALQVVRPHARSPVGLSPAMREAWARPTLAARWEDVLAWRDQMIERHRPQPST